MSGNMILDDLAKKKVISASLYRLMKTYNVKLLNEAVTFLGCPSIPERHREELEKIKYSIEGNADLFKKLSLRELYLRGLISVLLYNSLQFYKFDSFEQLVQYIDYSDGSYRLLLRYRYLGIECLREIRNIVSMLKSLDSIQNNTETEFVTYSSNDGIEADVERLNEVTRSATIKSLRKRNLISVRTYNCLVNNGFSTIDDVFEYIMNVGPIKDLLSIRNFGMKSFFELQNLLEQVKEPLKKDQISYKEKQLNDFILQYNELIKNNIYKSSIERYYDTSKAKLPARSIHILDANFNSILEVVCLYFEGVDIKKLKNCGKKTYDDLNTFVVDLYLYVSSLFTEDCQDAEIALLRNTYPFLYENEIEFVMDFKMKTSHLPMFYILYHYLINSSSRSEKIFCRYYGLKGEPEDLRDISENLDISLERCRQILLQNKISELSLCSSENWRYYVFLDNILFYNNYDYKRTLDDEGLSHLSLFAFVGLCSLVKEIKVCKMSKVSCKKYFVSERFYNSFDLKSCIKDIEFTLNKRCTEDVRLPISVFINSYWLNEPTFEISEIENIIIYILKEDYGIDVGNDKLLNISQNKIDRKKEIYSIIEENGNPMHIEQIAKALALRYPELSDITIEQVRMDAQKNPRIVSLGKSSTYAIDKWNLYTGTIRDLLYDILSKEDEPLNIKDLCNKVSSIYPRTNSKSISSSIASDELNRFVRFVGSYYGVAGRIYDEKYVKWDALENRKKNFDERLYELETFIKSHHHLPRNIVDNEAEASIHRWYKRVVNAADQSITPEQQTKMSDLLSRNKDYLITGTEYSFYRYCEEFKAFVEENMEFPTIETDSAKYTWFRKNMKVYKDFEDRRKTYFENLIEFLNTYGFEV